MDDLVTVVEGFRKYGRIVVTGPQRSGTRIASTIISDILGWEWNDEDKLCRQKSRDHDESYRKWCDNPMRGKTILQCPRISHACHMSPNHVLVVFMIRDVEDIIASDKHRVKKFRRLSKKGGSMPSFSVFKIKKYEYSKLFYNREPIELYDTPYKVYEVWNSIQKKHDFNYYELEYNLLEQHKLWLPLEKRRRFSAGTQTEV